MKDDLTLISGILVLLTGLVGAVVLIASAFYDIGMAYAAGAGMANAITRAVMLIAVALLCGPALMHVGEKIMRAAIYEDTEE